MASQASPNEISSNALRHVAGLFAPPDIDWNAGADNVALQTANDADEFGTPTYLGGVGGVPAHDLQSVLFAIQQQSPNGQIGSITMKRPNTTTTPGGNF